MPNRRLFSFVPGAGLLLMAVVLSTGTAFSQKAPSGGSSGEEKAAFEAVCGACHPTSVAEDMRSEAEWIETIEKMVSLGAKGTDGQFEALLRFLLRTRTKVNVNTAAAPEIAPVLDVSEAVAEAVVKRRTENGSFKNLSDLKKVPGLDAAKLESRRDRISF